jgi:adenylate cyclase
MHLRIAPDFGARAGSGQLFEDGCSCGARRLGHCPYDRIPLLETQKPLVLRVDPSNDATWTHIDIFEDHHLVEFVILPLRNADALPSAVSFATVRNSGFSSAERAALKRIAPALRNTCELRTLRRAEQALLGAYVGALTARRILEGHIRRGEVETLEAALMLCDLRDFTELSNRLPSERVLQLLDAYFGCVVPAINETGGEVIKFMGDAVLAFFHCEDASAACAACVKGALSALESLQALAISDAELRTGVALHYGKVGSCSICVRAAQQYLRSPLTSKGFAAVLSVWLGHQVGRKRYGGH